MALHPIPSLLALPLLIVFIIHRSDFSTFSGDRQLPTLEAEDINNYLKQINKHAVKSIKSPDGDIIDCVPIDKQPAFDNPLLKDHQIQMVPSTMPTNISHQISITSVGQSWNDVGRCPFRTVPIRRTTAEDVLRAGSLSQFGKKQPVGANARHEYAIACYPSCTKGAKDEIYGTKATFNLWNPYVEDNEFSLSQLWIAAGVKEDLNTIEAGWQVYPGLYGDSRTRLFIYWTSDGYKTGCYNLNCSGFVMTCNKVAIGGVISKVSTYAGAQREMTLLIWKDPSSGNWWLRHDTDTIGYWPAKLFTHLNSSATSVKWGGEIVNTRPNGVHTSTVMGSGHFPREGYKKASYIRDLNTVDSAATLHPVQSIETHASRSKCYNVISHTSHYKKKWRLYFYFGGPGNNSKCP